MKKKFIGVIKIATIVILILGLVVVGQEVPKLLNNDYTIVAVFLVAIISIIKQLQDIAKFTEEKFPEQEYKNGTFWDKLLMNWYFVTSHGFEYSIKFIIYLALVIALVLQLKAAKERIYNNIDLNSSIYLLKEQVSDLNITTTNLLERYRRLDANKTLERNSLP